MDNIQVIIEFKLGFFEEIMLFRWGVSLLIFGAPAAKAVKTVFYAVIKCVSEAYPIQEAVEYCVYVLPEKDIFANQILVDPLQSSLEVFFHIIACSYWVVIWVSRVHARVTKGILDLSPSLDLVAVTLVKQRPPRRLHVGDLFLFLFHLSLWDLQSILAFDLHSLSYQAGQEQPPRNAGREGPPKES